MTKLSKPVHRETGVFDRGRPLIITLSPTHIALRVKGKKKAYILAYDAALYTAINREKAR